MPHLEIEKKKKLTIMLPGYSPVAQAFMGTMMTWALTAAGSALAMVIKGSQVSFE